MTSFTIHKTSIILSTDVIYELDGDLIRVVSEIISESHFCFGTNNRSLVSITRFVEEIDEALKNKEYWGEHDTRKWNEVKDHLLALEKTRSELYIDLEN